MVLNAKCCTVWKNSRRVTSSVFSKWKHGRKILLHNTISQCQNLSQLIKYVSTSPGQTRKSSSRAERWSHALPHCGRLTEEAAVKPIPEGDQPRGGGRGSRAGHQHGPASGSAALQPEGEPWPASCPHECHRGQAETGPVLWRLPCHRGARVHASSEGQVPGGGADWDGEASASSRQATDGQAGKSWCLWHLYFYFNLLCPTNLFSH